MKILIVSPVPLQQNKQSGINIRITGVAQFLKDHGFKVSLTDKFNPKVLSKYDFIYCLVSTKGNSITTSVVNEIKDHKLILDLYTPVFLEKKLTFNPYKPTHWLNRKKQSEIVKKSLKKASYFTTANNKQKKYWALESKKIGEPIDTNLITVIPTSHKFHLKNKRNGKVILWFGGVYPWLDPYPLAQAFKKISQKYPNWKIRVLGGRYKGTDYDSLYNKFEKALMKLPKRQIEFIPWQDPKNLPKYLEDVSLAVHLPKNTEEDALAHRVRLLTLTNSQIPLLTSGDDEISRIAISVKAAIPVSSKAQVLSKQLANIIENKKILNKMTRNASFVEKIYLKKETPKTISWSQIR